LFADANFSYRSGGANLWDRDSGIEYSIARDSAGGSRTFALVDFATRSPLDAGWSPLNFAVSTTARRQAPLTERTSIDSYFGAFESLSKQGMNGALRRPVETR
jgi:hypothetical protein